MKRRIHRVRVCAPVLLGVWLLWGVGGAAADPDPTATKPKPNVFEGRVLDHENKPVANTAVRAVSDDGGFLSYSGPDAVFSYAPAERFLLFFPKYNGLRAGQAVTDDQGKFRIQGLKEGSYAVLAVHSERGIVIERDVQQPNPGEGVDVVLSAPTFLEGTITGLDAVGQSMVGRLNLSNSPPWQGRFDGNQAVVFASPSVELRGEGQFRVGPLPIGGEWTLSFVRYVATRSFPATLLSTEVKTHAGKTTKFDLDLTKGAGLTGVVNGPKGEPLPDVAVVISPSSVASMSLPGNPMPPAYGAVTDAEGKYTVLGAPAGSYQLTAYRYAPRTGFG